MENVIRDRGQGVGRSGIVVARYAGLLRSGFGLRSFFPNFLLSSGLCSSTLACPRYPHSPCLQHRRNALARPRGSPPPRSPPPPPLSTHAQADGHSKQSLQLPAQRFCGGVLITPLLSSPRRHCSPCQIGPNRRLGVWVAVQRVKYRKGQLRDSRIKKLESIGFSWELHMDWESRMQQVGCVLRGGGGCSACSRRRVGGSWWKKKRKNRQRAARRFFGSPPRTRHRLWVSSAANGVLVDVCSAQTDVLCRLTIAVMHGSCASSRQSTGTAMFRSKSR